MTKLEALLAQLKREHGDRWPWHIVEASRSLDQPAANEMFVWITRMVAAGVRATERQATDATPLCRHCKGGEVLELRVQADQKVLVDCVCTQSVSDLARVVFAAGYRRAQDDNGQHMSPDEALRHLRNCQDETLDDVHIASMRGQANDLLNGEYTDRWAGVTILRLVAALEKAAEVSEK